MSAEDWQPLISHGARAQIPLNTDEITELFVAFKSMDENGNGRLEREELQQVLVATGQESAIKVETLFENATDKAKTEGLDFEEFLRLLSDPKKQGGMASWYAKSKQLVKTYSDKKTAALASRGLVGPRDGHSRLGKVGRYMWS